jgi:Mor family transcriptional regulator
MINDNLLVDILVSHLVEDDIPEQYRTIVKAMGINSFIQLLKTFGGTSLYIPRIDTMIVKARNRMILKDYRGNCREIARKYDVTGSWVRRIVKAKGDPSYF